MFFNRSSDKESFLDQKQREEHERQQQLNLAKGAGSFLYRYIINASIFILTYVTLSMILINGLGVSFGTAIVVSIISAFFIFKIPHVKLHPIQSLVTIGFILGLVQLSFS